MSKGLAEAGRPVDGRMWRVARNITVAADGKHASFDELLDNAGLGRSSALMASGSMVSRVLGVVRNALLGFCIGGMGGASSAFQSANTLPNIIFIMLQSGVLTAILIPQLTRALRRTSGGEDAIDAC